MKRYSIHESVLYKLRSHARLANVLFVSKKELLAVEELTEKYSCKELNDGRRVEVPLGAL